MQSKNIRDKIYLLLVGVVSFISLVFLPMIGSSVGIEFQLPTTTAGWIVFITTKLIVAGLNMFIFHCFVKQGKSNVRDNEEYKEAWNKYHKQRQKDKHYVSPKEFYGKTYGFKGVSVFVITILSTFALTQCLLTYDLVSFLTYLFTIVMGVAFGLLEMKETEEYWTIEFVEYVEFMEEQKDGN